MCSQVISTRLSFDRASQRPGDRRLTVYDQHNAACMWQTHDGLLWPRSTGFIVFDPSPWCHHTDFLRESELDLPDAAGGAPSRT